jgi:hypothetical protein
VQLPVATFPGLKFLGPGLKVERWSAEVDQVLGQILRKAVWERLDMLDELASSADNGSLLSVARSELPRLTHGWRALLASHVPDPRGRCPECSSHWRSRATSCSVWRAAHEHLVPADPVSSGAVPSAATISESETISGSATVSGSEASGFNASWSVFSRFKINRNAWQVSRPATLFPAVIPTGAGATH